MSGNPPTNNPDPPQVAPDVPNTMDISMTMNMNGMTDMNSMNMMAIPNDFSQIPDPSLTFDPTMTPITFIPETMTTDTTALPISADEIALYDRQIRLWGIKAQEKIRSANILLIGMRALGNEIAKNLVLAGVGVLTIVDHQPVTEDDLGSQFFQSEDKIGQNRAQAAEPEIRKLNPRVQVYSDPDNILTKLPEYFSSFNITIATGMTLDGASQINISCRSYGGKFYAADVHGMYGYIFADLVLHDFVEEKIRGSKIIKPGDVQSPTRTVTSVSIKRENEKIVEVTTKQEIYSPLLLANSSPLPTDASRTLRSRLRVTPLLSCLRALFEFERESGGRLPGPNATDLQHFTRLAKEKHLELQLPEETLNASFLRSFLQNLGSELSPVTAFLGGRLAQDVINVLGQREQPLQNWLLFDGEEFKGPVYSLHPIFDDAQPVLPPSATTLPITAQPPSSTPGTTAAMNSSSTAPVTTQPNTNGTNTDVNGQTTQSDHQKSRNGTQVPPHAAGEGSNSTPNQNAPATPAGGSKQ